MVFTSHSVVTDNRCTVVLLVVTQTFVTCTNFYYKINKQNDQMYTLLNICQWELTRVFTHNCRTSTKRRNLKCRRGEWECLLLSYAYYYAGFVF